MVVSMRDTAVTGGVTVSVYVDSDDPRLHDYLDINHIEVTVGPRIRLSEAWNKLAERATTDILFQGADDVRFRTPGWDRQVLDAFTPDPVVLVYTADGFHDQKHAAHAFTHRRWHDILGYYLNPEFADYYTDTWNFDVARRAGRLRYLPEVLIEHMHPLINKADWDETYLDRTRRSGDTRQAKTLYQLTQRRRNADARKLEAACASSSPVAADSSANT
jgi:hypothetical protein